MTTTGKRPRRSNIITVTQEPQRIEPPMAQDVDRFALLVPGVLDAAECASLVERTEEVGYAEATMSVTGGGSVLRRDIRDNDRCILTDSALAARLWRMLQRHVPAQLEGQRATRLQRAAALLPVRARPVVCQASRRHLLR